ncbi:MAG: NAD(P)/FAD-dependent oxidoreductase [Gammaproteobacteria bacterium]
MPPPFIIVGSGLAGYSLARELRKLDKSTPLVILSADDGRYYSKPMLSNALTSGKTPAEIPISDAAAMARQLDAEVRTETRVTELDVDRRSLCIGNEMLEYRGLVLALGADPIPIPVQGEAAASVQSVNDLADYTRFRGSISAARHVTIMGAGLIGCEFANDLHSAGIEAEVIDPYSYPLGRLVPEPFGRDLQEGLARIGVRWHLGPVVYGVERSGGRLRVTLSDETRFETDAVLSAVGLRPRTALAARSGIKTARGIVVDRRLATSAAGVYALGDCMEIEGLVLPFVMPIMHAARALARTLTGTPTDLSYPAMPILVKTTAHPVVVSPPAAGLAGVWEYERESGGLAALFYSPDRQLQGFALSGSAVARKNELVKSLPPVLP